MPTAPSLSAWRSGAYSEYPLSPIQEGMLFHYASDVNSGVDIEQILIDYPETLNPDFLSEAWQRVVNRQPVLRTSLRWEGLTEPVQEVSATLSVSIECVDVQQLDCEAQSAQVHACVRKARRTGIDLKHPPLMTWTLFRLGPAHHQLLWTVHHILMDGRSFVLVLNEVEQCYQDLLRGEGLQLPEPLLYEPYIRWLRTIDVHASRDFWAKKLQGLSAPTPLLRDSSASEDIRDRYGELEHRLSRELSDSLRDLAANHEITLNTVVMGVWSILLHRYSGEQTVLFGATKTSRRGSVPGAESTVGLFLNTIPVRVDFQPEQSVLDTLRRLRSDWVELRNYEFTPLVEIRKASSFAPSQPLFNSLVMFEKRRFDTELATLGGAWPARKIHHYEQPGTPLSFFAYGEDSILLKICSDAGKYSQHTIRRMLGQIEHLLQEIAHNPAQRVSTIPVLPFEQKQEILVHWNATSRAYPKGVCGYELIAEQASHTPDRIAIVNEGREVTFREVNERASQIAHFLRKHGVGPNVAVAVQVERSPEMLISLLAVWKAGGAYVPLDPIYPQDRRAFMMEDSGARLLITDEYLSRHASEISAQSTADPTPVSGPEDLAYIIYTSGSTGKPKGVEIQHRAFLNFLWSFRSEPGLTGEDTLLAVTTISFDIAGMEMFLPLLTGARLIIAAREATMQPEQIERMLIDHSVTVMQATPATWQLLMDAGWSGKQDLKVLCGGEAMPPDLAERLLPRCSELWNLYGPTETTVWSTVHRVHESDPNVLIGHPIANTKVFILDSHLAPVPPGVPGELFIGGTGLARGYHNRAELTAEKFVRNPFDPGSRLYRTGDLARWTPDGAIECLGRTDHQVKIRGFRIEPGEIEAPLKQQPGVLNALVVARDDERHDKFLVAYVVPDASSKFDWHKARRQLRAVLPAYMVPADCVMVDSFPLTANNKIDRKALPCPDRNSLATTHTWVAPRNTTEERIAGILCELLGRDCVGAHDNFFEIGGHSLLATRLYARLGREGWKGISLGTILQDPTVEGIARAAQGEGRGVTMPRAGRHSIVEFNAGSANRPKLFWVPGGAGVGGHTQIIRMLDRLGKDQPLYTLVSDWPQSLDEVECVEERAKAYLSLVRATQPHGPYHFVGFCLGGTIAFEMAQQLTRVGERAALTGMIDTWFPVPPGRTVRLARTLLRGIHHVRSASTRELVDKCWKRVLNHTVDDQTSQTTDGIGYSADALLQRTVQMASRYSPVWYHGYLQLFIALDDSMTAGLSRRLDPRYGWISLAEEVGVREVNGTHDGILEPRNIYVLADEIGNWLQHCANP